MDYKFTKHITLTTKPFAERLAKKHSLTLEESGPLALFFVLGANEKDGKGQELVEEFIDLDMMSDEFDEKMKQLHECDGAKELITSLEKMTENQEKGKQRQKRKSRKQ